MSAKEIVSEIGRCASVALQEIKRAAQVYLESGEAAAFAEIYNMRIVTLATDDAKEDM